MLDAVLLLREDVKGLREDVKKIEGDVKKIDGDVKDLRRDFQILDNTTKVITSINFAPGVAIFALIVKLLLTGTA